MSSPRVDRRAAVLGLAGALAGLSGCGFRPLYGRAGDDASGASGHLAAVRVSPIPDRMGQILRNALLDRLTPRGRPQKALYQLDVSLEPTRSDLVILQDATSTFAKVRIKAKFALTDIASGAPLTRGKSESTTIFNIVESEFANIKAETAARGRAVNEISDDIRLRLGLFFRRQLSS